MDIKELTSQIVEPETSDSTPKAENVDALAAIGSYALDLSSGSLLTNEATRLPDKEFLEVSQEFGNEYVELLTGNVTTDLQEKLSGLVISEMAPLLAKTEGLQGKELARFLIRGYRAGTNKIYTDNGRQPKFDDEAIDEDVLSHVVDVVDGPFGVPIIYTDGKSEEIFGHDTLSFASSELMIENVLPPIAVVYDRYNPEERQKVTAHESSHLLFALLRRAGVIPSPDGEGLTRAGKKTAFELARDEAVAQMSANQNAAFHPNVVKYMKEEGIDEATIAKNSDVFRNFTRATADQVGLKFSDAILGVLTARNFGELHAHMDRMHHIAELRPVVEPETSKTEVAEDPSAPKGWGSIAS